MAKVHVVHDSAPRDKIIGYMIFCPGCQKGHLFVTDQDYSDRARVTPLPAGQHGPVWTFNGNMEKPTFRMSMLVNQHEPNSRCHSMVTDGKIAFGMDCFHSLKGQTVDLPDF